MWFSASVLLACVGPSADDSEKTNGEGDPGPMEVTGWSGDVAIAPDDGDSQGEPSSVVLSDGTILASWMELEGYTLYIKYSRSTDGGATWSTPDYIDRDKWGYQNDPVLIQSGDYVYFTWLAVEGSSYDKSNIYCKDSTDGGQTWSDAVQLTEKNTFNDRQWFAVDGAGRAVATWDLFPDSYSETQVYSETAGGCAGFAPGEEVYDGYFLNGVPVITSTGDVWISRDQMKANGVAMVVQKREGDGWGDEVELVTTGFSYGMTHETADDPGDTGDTGAVDTDQGEEGEDDPPEAVKEHILDEVLEQRTPPWERTEDVDGPTDSINGQYSGTYSPVLGALPDGRIAVAGLGLVDGSDADAEVWFAIHDPATGDTTASQLVSTWSGGAPQQEPWMTVDPYGGVHLIYFDARENEWRLRSATSVDGGATFTEADLADDTFKKGFSEQTQSDLNAWVGHFQGFSSSPAGIVATWGDSRDSNVSRIYAAAATWTN